jgi:phenylacetate-CoA ligase
MQLHERLYSQIVSRLALPIGDRVYGQRMMQEFDFLRRVQWWDADRLMAHQDESLRRLIRTAYDEVPHYRQSFDAAGVRPEDIRTAADLRHLPILTKADLRGKPLDEFSRPTGQTTYDACSSGSTGQPLCVREDAYTAGWYRAATMLAFTWAGWQPGLAHVQTGMTLARPAGRRLKDQILRCHYVNAYDLTDAHLDSVLDHMEAHGERFLMGYPGSLYYLARRAAARGWNRPLTGIITWGDTLYAHYRKTIEAAFGAHVTDTYGVGEGIQVAAQCGHETHYHIHATQTIVEFVDDDGQPVPEGSPGNILLTRLHPGPTPLIRYQVGDVGTGGGWVRCECGRGLPIMGSIQGRDTDNIITPGGNRLIVHFFTGIIEFFTQVEVFQVIQEQRDSVRLLIVPRADYTDAVGEEIVRQLKARGADIAIQVEVVPDIPTAASGKRRFVINRLGAL